MINKKENTIYVLNTPFHDQFNYFFCLFNISGIDIRLNAT